MHAFCNAGFTRTLLAIVLFHGMPTPCHSMIIDWYKDRSRGTDLRILIYRESASCAKIAPCIELTRSMCEALCKDMCV